MILSDLLFSSLCLFLLFDLIREDLRSWGSSDFFQFDRLKPTFRLYHLALNLSYAGAIVIESLCEGCSDLPVYVLGVNASLITMVIAIETVF